MADSIDAASSWTGINTLLIDASIVGRTLAVENTLWSTSYKGVSLKSRLAGAHSSVATCLADGITSTWRWLARVFFLLWHYRLDDFRPLGALRVRISYVVLQTGASRCVVDDVTLSIETADIFARILALLSDASKVR
jgi:hypothetical protein